jgi:hypothetical protein
LIKVPTQMGGKLDEVWWGSHPVYGISREQLGLCRWWVWGGLMRLVNVVEITDRIVFWVAPPLSSVSQNLLMCAFF